MAGRSHELESQALAGGDYGTLFAKAIEGNGDFKLVARRNAVCYDIWNIGLLTEGGAK